MDYYNKEKHEAGYRCDTCLRVHWISMNTFPDVVMPRRGPWSGIDHHGVLEKYAGWTIDRIRCRYTCMECSEGKMCQIHTGQSHDCMHCHRSVTLDGFKTVWEEYEEMRARGWTVIHTTGTLEYCSSECHRGGYVTNPKWSKSE